MLTHSLKEQNESQNVGFGIWTGFSLFTRTQVGVSFKVMPSMGAKIYEIY